MNTVLFFHQLAQLITNAGGVGAVVDYIRESKGNVRLPGIMMLGYVAAHSESLAMSVIISRVRIIIHVLDNIVKVCVFLHVRGFVSDFHKLVNSQNNI